VIVILAYLEVNNNCRLWRSIKWFKNIHCLSIQSCWKSIVCCCPSRKRQTIERIINHTVSRYW